MAFDRRVRPTPSPRRPAPGRFLGLLATLILVGPGACAEPEAEHPWIGLGPDSPHRIVEASGLEGNQAVIVMPPDVSREEALALGRMIQSQAPAGATINVRLFNDEATALSWRTAPAEWTLQHLLVVVQIVPETGLNEVRWVGPES